MVKYLTYALIAIVSLAHGSVHAETLHDTGKSWRVVDGDTIRIRPKVYIRLHGIDAPEQKQTCRDGAGDEWRCGASATAFLAHLVENGGRLSCTILGHDRYRRMLGRCRVAATGEDGGGEIDLQEAMVRSGLAVAEYAPDYIRAERDAGLAGRGIWQGEFLRPKDYRKAIRASRVSSRKE